MKIKPVFCIVLLFLFMFGCFHNLDDLNNNTNEEPIREKWDYFDFDYLYVDEMNFDVSIPQEFWGNWGYEKYIVAANESTNKLDLINIDYTLWLINQNVQYPTPENKYSNVAFILSENKLIFSLNICRIYNSGLSPNHPEYKYKWLIISKSDITFNLIAARKYISEAPDWDINDYYENMEYYFLSEDEQYGFTFVVYGYNLFYGNNLSSVSTNLFSVPDTTINGSQVYSFMGFNSSKLE